MIKKLSSNRTIRGSGNTYTYLYLKSIIRLTGILRRYSTDDLYRVLREFESDRWKAAAQIVIDERSAPILEKGISDVN